MDIGTPTKLSYMSAETAHQKHKAKYHGKGPNATLVQTTLDRYAPFKPRSQVQQRIDMNLTTFLVGGCYPFEIVRCPHFQKLLKTFEPRIYFKHPTTFSRTKLPLCYDNVRVRVHACLTKHLPHIDTVAFTCDFWKARSTHMFINISIHFVTATFKLRHFALRFEKWTGRETGNNIAKQLADALNTVPGLEKKDDKQLVMVTDGDRKLGAGIRKCVVPLTHLKCVDHQLELCLKAGFDHSTDTPPAVREALDAARGLSRRVNQSGVSNALLQAEAEAQGSK